MFFPQVANLSQMCVSHVMHEHVHDVHARMPMFVPRNQFNPKCMPNLNQPKQLLI